MNQIIECAIRNKELISFTYNGYQRIVEPHTYGMTTTGKESLRAYQVEGGHASGHNQPWHLFTVSKMISLATTNRRFSDARQGYTKLDSAMQTIYAQL